MARGISWSLLAPLVCVGLLTGCRFDLFPQREAWRVQAEEQCIAAGGVTPSVYIAPMRPINGPGACGMEHPFRISALGDGTVGVKPQATLACPMIHELNQWIEQVVQPAAMAWMGQPVVAIRQMSAYSCRGMNGQVGAKISEHAFGNAFDVGGFRFADGRDFSVQNGWKGAPDIRGFLLQVQAGACEEFTTVLAPGSNIYHYNHIHVDLMRRNKPRLICKPKPQPLPAPPIAVSAQPPEQPQPGDLPAPRNPYMQQPPQMEPPQAQEQVPPAQPPQAAPAGEAEAPEDILPPGAHPPQQAAPSYPQPPGQPPQYPQPPYQPPQYPSPQVYQQPAPHYPAYPQGGGPPRSYPGAGQPHYPPPGDAEQPVLLPPGNVPSAPHGPGPMSYATPANGTPATPRAVGPFVGGGIAVRKYYSVPIPQASTIPLPVAVPGED